MSPRGGGSAEDERSSSITLARSGVSREGLVVLSSRFAWHRGTEFPDQPNYVSAIRENQDFATASRSPTEALQATGDFENRIIRLEYCHARFDQAARH
jgi:hypothetical protein